MSEFAKSDGSVLAGAGLYRKVTHIIVEARTTYGGTGHEAVRVQLKRAHEVLEQDARLHG